MSNLKCHVNSCLHQSGNLCNLNSIQVEGPGATAKDQTCCSSFFNESNDPSNSSAQNNMYASESTTIKCKATNCTHNKSKKCQANEVEVYEMCTKPRVMSETACQTFCAR